MLCYITIYTLSFFACFCAYVYEFDLTLSITMHRNPFLVEFSIPNNLGALVDLVRLRLHFRFHVSVYLLTLAMKGY